MPPKKKSVKPADINWNNEKKAKPKQNFEDIMSKFLKDSEERLQDVKKHQDVKQRKRKSISNASSSIKKERWE